MRTLVYEYMNYGYFCHCLKEMAILAFLSIGEVYIIETTSREVAVLNKIRGRPGICDPLFMSKWFMAILATF